MIPPMTPPMTGAESPYGTHAPGWIHRNLILSAQKCPRGWLCQQWAQLMRRWILFRARLPLDVSVGAVRMRCHLRDNNSERKFIFMPWRFDRVERMAMRRVLAAEGVLLDIGANVGIYSLDAMTALGPQGRILAFEPNPQTLARLRFNLEATRAGLPAPTDIDVIPVGVGDANATVALNLDPRNLGGCSICETHAGTRAVEIECRLLLDVLVERNVTRIDVLKIDIEGAEERALLPFFRSAPPQLLPRMILIENSERYWSGALPAVLDALGYRCEHRNRRNSIFSRSGH